MEDQLHCLSKAELVALVENQRREHLALEKSSADIIAERDRRIARQQQELAHKQELIGKLKRMLFGQKRERFVAPENQMPLPFAPDPAREKTKAEVHEQKITYLRTKTPRPNHKGRLPLPDHLPVEEVRIYPEGDLAQMVCIGSEVTDELEYEPARLYIKRYIRYKYAARSRADEGIRIGELPQRVIERGMAGPGLLTSVLIDKYCDHLPLYRQLQRFKRLGVPIAYSTLQGWTRQGLEKLQVLYDHLVADTIGQGYLQVDETPIKVLESQKKDSCHLGYYWVYHSPLSRTVLFDYQPSRSRDGPAAMLADFKGYLQTDGYGAYEKIGAGQHVKHLGCWAHVRRKFVDAMGNDPGRAEYALLCIQRLYAVEWISNVQNHTADQRKEHRLDEALPVINHFGKWITRQYKQVLPRSMIGLALQYAINQWDHLSTYLYDGNLKPDNNQVENALRAITIGRKNYLFAGSHQAARRAAMVYSFLAICKKHEVEPFQWLRYTLEHIDTTRYKDVRSLYPQNFKSICGS